MATYLFPSGAGHTPTGSYGDPAPLNLGTLFALSTNIDITGVRIYIPTSTSTVTAQLWENGVKVAEKAGQAVSTGWNTILFDTPYAGTTGVDYVASALQSSGTARYTALNGVFANGTTGVLVTVGPASSFSTFNALYTYGTGIPATQPGGAAGTWYGVDAVLDDAASPDAVVTAVTATATAAAGIPTATGAGVGVVTAVKATATAAAGVPTVSGILSPTVAAVRATASASAPIGAVEVTHVLSGGGAATATAAAGVPSVFAGGNSTVIAVRAQATAAAKTGHTIIGGTVINATVAAVTATATANAGTSPEVRVVETMSTNVGYGRITGRFATSEVLIGDADGLPNLFPITSRTITFTSTVAVLRNPTASPAPIVIEPEPIICTLDSGGYLVDSAGHRWVDLIATDDPDLVPLSRKWTVTGSTGFKWQPFQISVATSSNVDLSTLIPT